MEKDKANYNHLTTQNELDNLRHDVHALEAWQNVAAESNRDVSAYLRNRFPSWASRFDEGMPVDNIRRVIEYLDDHVKVGNRQVVKMRDKTSASEALFGFVGWLTYRDKAVTFSGHHDAGIAADLVGLFCKVNDLAEPRDGWNKNLVHPKECHPAREVIGGVTEEDRPSSSWRPHLEQILSKLSGDLNHDNVAAAKQILKEMLEK